MKHVYYIVHHFKSTNTYLLKNILIGTIGLYNIIYVMLCNLYILMVFICSSHSATQVKGSSGTFKPGWINLFKFPDLPEAISAKVTAGEPLTFGNESVILDVIFEAVKPHSL